MFSQTCQSIGLEQKATIRAKWKTDDGSWIKRTLDLDTLIGNKNGHFNAPGRRFSVTANNVHLQEFVLHADLEAENGQYRHDSLALDEVLSIVEGDRIVPLKGKRATANLETCGVCKGFPTDNNQLGISTADPSFTVSLKKLQEQKAQSDCQVCHLLRRIAEELSRQDSRYANPNTICSGGTPDKGPILNSTPLVWIHFRLDGNHPLEKKYALYKEKSERGLLASILDTQVASVTFTDVRVSKHVSYHPTSDKAIKQVQTWTSQCVLKHRKCSSAEGTLPTRILDLGTQDSEIIKLVAGKGRKATYACLSYCWGDAVGEQLRDDNFQEFQNGKKVASLPKTYRDTIAFCRRMSLRYLWIDALCIKQRNKQDWLQESVKMAQYYGDCHLCIAATSSHNLDAGCNAASSPIEFKGVGQDGKPYQLFLRPLEFDHIGHGSEHNRVHFPLLTRAWCYQERRLAPRVLHFCGAELLFECEETIACQCGAATNNTLDRGWTKNRESFSVNHKDIATTKDSRQKSIYQWHACISAFSNLNIRHISDRLVAVAGLAEHTKSDRDRFGVSSGRYLAGLWEHHLIEDMAWCVGKDLTKFRNEFDSWGFGSVSHPKPAQLPRPNEYVAPSWSWASVQDPVHYNVPLSTPLCAVVRAETTLASDSELGPVTGGYIVLRAKLRSSRWGLSKGFLSLTFWSLEEFRSSHYSHWGSGLEWYPDHGLSQDWGKETEKLFLMPLASRARAAGHPWIAKAMALGNLTVYLVLRHKAGNAYERVGWSYTEGKEADMGSVGETEIRIE